MIYLFLIFFIGFFNRIIIVLNARTDFDTFGHLYFAKEVKDQKVGPFGTIQTKVAGANGFKTQFFWHWLIGFLPFNKIIKIQKWVNPFFDVIFSLLIYLVSIRYGLDARASFFVALIYLLTPMWFSRVSTGPRLKSLTPRLSSEIATNLFFIVTLLPLGMPFSMQLISGIILSSFVILSFKFGLQAVLFLAPLISLFTFNFTPFLSVLIALILSIIISKGDFIETLKYHLIHLNWYFKKNLKGEMPISRRNSLSSLLDGTEGEKGVKRIVVFLWNLVAVNSFASVLLKMPIFIISVGGIIYFYLNGINDVIPQNIVGVIAAGTIIYLITNIPLFLFIGEAERYLNHIAYFIVLSFIMIIYYLGNETLLYAVLIYGLIYWIIESFFLHKFRTVDELNEKFSEDVFNFLKNKGQNSVILLYPYHAIGGVWRVMLNTKHKVVCYMASDREYRKKLEEKYTLNYPYLNLNLLEDMSKEYGVDVLVIDRKHLRANGFEDWSPPVNWKKLDVGGTYYHVYEKNE